MNLAGKLLVSLVIATIASSLLTWSQHNQLFNLSTWALFLLATASTVVVTSLMSSGQQAHSQPSASNAGGKSQTGSAQRELGRVKWFNVTKGFGFIVKDDGEEVFVHFRSIQGTGRRGLRDGQRVSFAVAQSDKGPQAEAVEVL